MPRALLKSNMGTTRPRVVRRMGRAHRRATKADARSLLVSTPATDVPMAQPKAAIPQMRAMLLVTARRGRRAIRRLLRANRAARAPCATAAATQPIAVTREWTRTTAVMTAGHAPAVRLGEPACRGRIARAQQPVTARLASRAFPAPGYAKRPVTAPSAMGAAIRDSTWAPVTPVPQRLSATPAVTPARHARALARPACRWLRTLSAVPAAIADAPRTRTAARPAEGSTSTRARTTSVASTRRSPTAGGAS
jgi:hypothetical protein